MLPGKAPRRSHSEAYETLRELSPWDVQVDVVAVEQLEAVFVLHPFLEGLVIDKLLPGLRAFPPDPRFFTDPEMSLGDSNIWVTLSERHLRIRVKAEYRREEQCCWVVHIRAEQL